MVAHQTQLLTNLQQLIKSICQGQAQCLRLSVQSTKIVADQANEARALAEELRQWKVRVERDTQTLWELIEKHYGENALWCYSCSENDCALWVNGEQLFGKTSQAML